MKSTALLRTLMMIGILIGLSRPVGAQMVGLPLLDTAGTRDPGNLEATPGIALGDDMNFLGARATITILDELRGFIDLGRLDTRNKGDNLALQVGGLCSLPMSDICDTAVRGAFYYSNTDFLDIMGGNVMLMGSDETLLDDLYAYGGVGVDVSKKKIYFDSHSEINPAISAGLTYKITENFWAFLEGDYVDGWYLSTGLSIR